MALQALRQDGVRADNPRAWEALLTCVAGVPPCLTLASLPEWPWSSFPQASNHRPPKKFYAVVMGALRLVLRSPHPLRVRPGFVAGDAASRRFLRRRSMDGALAWAPGALPRSWEGMPAWCSRLGALVAHGGLLLVCAGVCMSDHARVCVGTRVDMANLA